MDMLVWVTSENTMASFVIHVVVLCESNSNDHHVASVWRSCCRPEPRVERRMMRMRMRMILKMRMMMRMVMTDLGTQLLKENPTAFP